MAKNLQRGERGRGDAVLDLGQHPDREARGGGKVGDRHPLLATKGADRAADRHFQIAFGQFPHTVWVLIKGRFRTGQGCVVEIFHGAFLRCFHD